ncbi:hypothetical protein IB227_03670 [Stenotrophomonas sp. STM01]|uniref:hypothetical protein n=1 Tax=Stenotrophomonas sp. STM01 TaxID=2769278 RepID=UPI00177DA1BC|nr:hypothetical protein [Stenotrophomonas sp. STM01]MBD9534945.1 hypothetical protein [Stenotrophomonas sp. STM01]
MTEIMRMRARLHRPDIDSPHWHEHLARLFLETRMPPAARTVFFLLLATQTAAGWAAQHTEPLRVGYTERDRAFGFTFTPPAGKDWKQDKWGSGNLSVDWNAGSTTDSRKIEAYMTRPDVPTSPLSGYIENIRRKLEQDFSNSPAATINHLQVSEYPTDKRCASIHLRLELRQPAADGQRQWAEQYTLSCGSPRYADVGYELRYYHRYTDAHRDPNLQAKAEQVLGSMRIEED